MHLQLSQTPLHCSQASSHCFFCCSSIAKATGIQEAIVGATPLANSAVHLQVRQASSHYENFLWLPHCRSSLHANLAVLLHAGQAVPHLQNQLTSIPSCIPALLHSHTKRKTNTEWKHFAIRHCIEWTAKGVPWSCLSHSFSVGADLTKHLPYLAT